MIKSITGCLIKYDKPWPDGSIIQKGAFNENPIDKIPVTTHFRDWTNTIGFCELEYRDDGVYYIFHPVDTEAAKRVLDEKTVWDENCYIGPFCNKVCRQKEDQKIVEKANIVSGAISFGKYESSYVESIELEK